MLRKVFFLIKSYTDLYNEKEDFQKIFFQILDKLFYFLPQVSESETADEKKELFLPPLVSSDLERNHQSHHEQSCQI